MWDETYVVCRRLISQPLADETAFLVFIPCICRAVEIGINL
ncbi:MAG TPA: hypothetical protein VH592_14020 [Gemmataceae bacterium]